MCIVPKAPKVQPIPTAPTASPTALDETALTAKADQRKKLRAAYGRQATMTSQGAGVPSMPVKTALGQ